MTSKHCFIQYNCLRNETPKCVYTAQDLADHWLRVEDVTTIEVTLPAAGPISLFNKERVKEPEPG